MKNYKKDNSFSFELNLFSMCAFKRGIIPKDSTIIEDANDNEIDEKEIIEEVKGDKKIQSVKCSKTRRKMFKKILPQDIIFY